LKFTLKSVGSELIELYSGPAVMLIWLRTRWKEIYS